MEGESCRMCGGDGRIGNALGGSSAKCPSCHGSGRRAEAAFGFHDVTRTKPSHYRQAPVPVASGPKVPITSEAVQLASEVTASEVLAQESKARLIAEIVNHEIAHGRCTKTFIRKIRKQVKPAP